uniref:Gustatory receptor n=1 Tax=Tribolium castaneum TaxID=7070 RepID=A2AX67_TRICA|nr:gustatory receptor candidate 5 [Tribolium castaneum]
MTIQLLSLICKFGGWMGLTPVSVEPTGFSPKGYSLLWILLFTLGVTISGVYRTDFYKKLSPMRLIVQTCLDFLLLALNISTILTTVRKQQQWAQLIQNLKVVATTKTKAWFLPFVVTNIIFVLFHTYEAFVWTRIMGVAYYEQYAVEFFQFYAQFIVYFLIYAVLEMLLQKYKTVTYVMTGQLKAQNSNLLKSVCADLCLLSECVDLFNSLFGFLVLLLVALTTLQLLIYIQVIVIGTKNTIETVAYSVIFILWHIVGTFSGIFLCDLIRREIANVQVLAYKIEAKRRDNEIKMFVKIVDASCRNFTAARFFELNRRTILGVSNAVITFLIVMVQKASYEKLSPVVLFIQVAADTVLFILNISTIIITARKKQQWNSLIKILKTVSNRNDKGDIFWFSPFLVANLAFVTIVTYETFVWTQIMGAEFFKLYAVEYFQMYAQFIVGTFNSVFICDLIEQKVKNIQMLVYQNEAEEVKILLDVINHFPHFTAARFFDLNRKTILGVLNALFTFLIVVVQFENLTS